MVGNVNPFDDMMSGVGWVGGAEMVGGGEVVEVLRCA